MDIIYADSLILLNALVDYLILLAAGRINCLPLARWRLALAAAFGGAYALAAVLLPDFFALASVKILAGLIMCAVAYGFGKVFPRLCLTAFAVAAAFGGAVYALAGLAGLPRGSGLYVPVSGRVLLLSFAVCYCLISLLFRARGRQAERKLHSVEIFFLGRKVSFTALYDSGNELTDPISGQRVLVAEAAALAPLFPEPEPLFLADAAAALEKLSAGETGGKLRLLCYRTAAAESGLLLCFRPEKILVDGKVRRGLAAVSRGSLSPSGEYRGLI